MVDLDDLGFGKVEKPRDEPTRNKPFEIHAGIRELLQGMDDDEARRHLIGLEGERLSEVERRAIDIVYCRYMCHFLGLNYCKPSMPKARLAAYLLMP